MNLIYYLRKAASLPPRVVFQKAVKLVRRKVSTSVQRRRDARRSTFSHPKFPEPHLRTCFSAVSADSLDSRCEQISALTEHYLAHRFDLLGAGWVQVRHGLPCRGLEGQVYPPQPVVEPDRDGLWLEGRINPANLSESRRVFGEIDPDYTPIDWHLDFKSGYRWRENLWHRDIPYGHLPGVDIKVPWELARMQHLVQLAWAWNLAKDGRPGFHSPDVYLREYRNQILDFVAANPPRFGVNWRCTMDVAIRTANWLTAYDFFKSAGAVFDPAFESELMRSVFDHALYIINHLEWDPVLRSNHYLADVTGLLFAAAHLPRMPETDAWLAFSVRELVAEMNSEFHPDGTNFEASTCYHRLSGEMMVYGTALVLGLPEEKLAALGEYDSRLVPGPPGLPPPPVRMVPLPGSDRSTPFPEWYFERLEKLAEFTLWSTKPNGTVPQVGDNDSGRFLKLDPVFSRKTVAETRDRYRNLDGYTYLPEDADYWQENHLDHRHLVAAVNGLFNREDFHQFAGSRNLETGIVRALAGNLQIPSRGMAESASRKVPENVGSERDWTDWVNKLEAFPESRRCVTEFPSPAGDLREALTTRAFPDFGLYLFRSSRLYLAVRLGPVGQNGNGGHAHNDLLALELCLDGKGILTDPGSYLYTPLPHQRNEYRSIQAHFAPQLDGMEPAPLSSELFLLESKPEEQCYYFGPEGFIGTHRAYGKPVYRVVQVMKDKVVVKDYVEGRGTLRPGPDPTQSVPLSTGYGWRLR